MALKFLNKKGWHTGSLRNIENVWKAEQKNDAEQKKLEELKKQIHEERERAEFRQIQEQAGFIPRQERLEFLYDSGLAVGKSSSSSGFKELEAYPKPPEPQAPPTIASSSSSAQQQQSVPGALFGEEKPQSANDSWRKLHSDPLLLIRKREQEALARVKNNPVQMAMIRKSVEAVKEKKETKHRHKKSKHRHEKSKHKKHYSDSESPTSDNDERKSKNRRDEDLQRKRNTYKDSKNKEESSYHRGRSPEDLRRNKTNYKDSKNQEKEDSYKNVKNERDLSNKRRNSVKISEEERAKRLKEMQIDAEINEEQRWKRIKKAEEKDKYEAIEALQVSGGRNFLDEAKRSVYGAEKGGSSTIEESVRRRKYYSQNKSGATESNAFRR